MTLSKTKSVIIHAMAEMSKPKNLSFSGNGKVSVSVNSIVTSQKVQRQVSVVREIAASQSAYTIRDNGAMVPVLANINGNYIDDSLV